MRGYANGRGLSPVTDNGFAGRRNARSAHLAPSRRGAHGAEPGRVRLDTARRTLDGVGGLGWSVIGFLLGAVFWHFVGFWSFVSNVVLSGHPSGSVDRSHAAAVQSETSQTTTGFQDVPLALAWCTALRLDRTTGATSAHRCAHGFAPSPGNTATQREDRSAPAKDAEAWVAPNMPAR